LKQLQKVVKDKLGIKKELYKACLKSVEKRMQTIEERLKLIEESRDNETKSSVGDKYETGRAMMQMEEEKSSAQLLEITNVRQRLSKIQIEKIFDKVEVGSLVSTNKGEYFISAGIGKIKINEEVFYCISIESPIGQLLRNKRKGGEIEFNKNKIQILDIN